VLFAGQIVERKGLADLLHAWMLIAPPLRAGAELLVVGDDPHTSRGYRVQMQQLAGELGCPARFVGFQQDVWQWLTAADVAVVPSHAEPLGNATLEAMSCGLPVIGCDVGGIPEMVAAEATGLLVPPRNPAALAGALERLLGDAALRLRLGVAGRARCEQLFDLGQHVNSVVQQYRLVLAGRINHRDH
jgi:glycosyltransferase involved in cell wall biosynthesis